MSRRILVVEDTEDNRQIIRDLLSSVGYELIEATDGAEGVALATSNSAIEIQKVGFEQFVANSAREHGLLYGFTTAGLALLTGWIASVVFRRD